MSTNLSNSSNLEFTANTYNLIANSNVINAPATGYYFYMGGEQTLVNFDNVTFNVPVIFTTKPANGTGDGNNKTISITGTVVFNKGVIYETNGRYNTADVNLSVFNFGDVDTLQMTCKYTNATLSTNLVPLNINGYGKVYFKDTATINAYVQPFAVACIDQLASGTSIISRNIYQEGNNVLNVYLDSQMVGTNLIDMRQYIVYPDVAVLIYNLYIIADVEIQLIRFPQTYQIYVTAANATLTDIEFTDTVNIEIAPEAKLSFEACTFSLGTPLISLTGSDAAQLGFNDDNTLSPVGSNNKIIENPDNVVIITSSTSTVNLPAPYTFNEPVTNYEGFTFMSGGSGTTYNFGTFNNKTLYINALGGSTTNIIITAYKGVQLLNQFGSSMIINNSTIFAANTFNNNYAVYKASSGGMSFTGTNNLFINSNTFFIRDITLDGNNNYYDIGEANIKFYIMDNVVDFSSFVFNIDNYNYNGLYYLATRGVFIGTENGQYNITAQFLIKNDTGTLSLGSNLGLGLQLLNDTTGDYTVTNYYIKGIVGASSPTDGDTTGRLYLNNSCAISISDMELYDNDYVPSPLLFGTDNSLSVAIISGVNFNMNSTQVTYLYNDIGSNIINDNNAFIIIGVIDGDKTYNLDYNISDNTTDPPFVYNNYAWYGTPIKFAANNTYNLNNINANGVRLYETNSPTLILTTFNPITIYNVENESIIIHNSSVLSNINNNTHSPLILQTNDLAMDITVNGVRFNVYGIGSISKTGTGEVTGISNTNTNNVLFPDMAPFIDENILAGDKVGTIIDVNDNIIDARLAASYWQDLGDDVFDDWGYFYIYDVNTGKYYFPLINPRNQNDGVFTTQTFNVFGRTYTIKHGWAVQGIFKFDITSSDNAPFRFGAYGEMGSDGNEFIEDLTYNYTIDGNNLTLFYHHHEQNGDSTEILYSYFISKTISENNSKTYNAYYTYNPRENNDNDDMSTMSKAVTNGLIVYYAKTNDVKEWVANDLNIVSGGIVSNDNTTDGGVTIGESVYKDMNNQIYTGIFDPNSKTQGGAPTILHHYPNDYNLTVEGLVPDLEYNLTIYIHDGNYSYINAAYRLTFETDTNGENPTFTDTTNITKGLTLTHNYNGTVTFNGITYTVSDNDSELIMNGNGVVNLLDCYITSTSNAVTDDIIKLNGSNNFTIDNTNAGSLSHSGTGAFINVGNNGILSIINATIINDNGYIIYSTSNYGGTNLLFDTVTFTNNTNNPVIINLNNTDISINACQFNQTITRTGAIIELGSTNSILNSGLVVQGTTTITGGASYYFFIKAYTFGNINTADTVMSASHTNVYWVNLGQVYNDGNSTPYTADTGLGYAAYSFDPTITESFTHKNIDNGMFLTSDDSEVITYNNYIAVGNDDTTSYIASLACTQFTDLNNNNITANLNDVFTQAIFQAGYVGSINNTNTQTFTINAGNRVLPVPITFANSSGIYLGNCNFALSFDTNLSSFNYTIADTVTEPDISIDATTLEVLDTVTVPPQVITFNLTKGYILPIYITPDFSNIITFFTFQNNADPQAYVDYATYSGYPNSVNKNLLQFIPATNTSGNFNLKYIGTGVYYEPTGVPKAYLDLSLYSDNINQTLVYSTATSETSILINNDTPNAKHPLSYVNTLTDFDELTTLYGLDEGVATELATLDRGIPAIINNFTIEYTFTLKFKMPLITYDIEGVYPDHMIHIDGNNLYAGTTLTITYSNPTGCTIDSQSSNNCVLTYAGDDNVDNVKTVDVSIVIPNIFNPATTSNIYFKRPDYEFSFDLYDATPLKGFNANNELIEVTGTTQVASTYIRFPADVFISAEGTTYAPSDNSPTIDINKGDTKTVSLVTTGYITANTPGVSGGALSIGLYISTSQTTNIMPYSFEGGVASISVTTGNYEGTKDITFTQNNKISGSGSTYTLTFGEEFATVPSIIYNDLSEPHFIYYSLAIQPDTREINSMNYSSNDEVQAPNAFTVSSTPTIEPSSYKIGFPVGVYTNFIPYTIANGANATIRANYVLVGAPTTLDPLVKGTHYQTFTSDMSTITNNYVDINNGNYDEYQYIYFALLTTEYQYIDVYIYYSDISGTDMANVPADTADIGDKVKIARYDFSNGFQTATNTLEINMGAWTIKPNSNGNLVFVYNGTIDGQNTDGAGSIFTLQAPTTLVNKVITTENL